MSELWGLECPHADCFEPLVLSWRVESFLIHSKLCPGCEQPGVETLHPVTRQPTGTLHCAKCQDRAMAFTGWVNGPLRWAEGAAVQEAGGRDFGEADLPMALEYMHERVGGVTPSEELVRTKLTGGGTQYRVQCPRDQIPRRDHADMHHPSKAWIARTMVLRHTNRRRVALYFRWNPAESPELATDGLAFQCDFVPGESIAERRGRAERHLTYDELMLIKQANHGTLPAFDRPPEDLNFVAPKPDATSLIKCQHCKRELPLRAINFLTVRNGVEKGD